MRGAKNSITDVAGVRVGHLTFSRDLRTPQGAPAAARTGLTAVLPAAMEDEKRYPFAAEVLGAGLELTGFEVAEDFAYLNSPLVLTNSANLGRAYDAALSYGFALKRAEIWPPVVIGLDDSWLNGLDGECLEESAILETFRRAGDGKPEEGSVGIGTGLRALGAKGGVGTASRVVRIGDLALTCGVLAVSGFAEGAGAEEKGGPPDAEGGALVLVLATDAPLLPHDLRRLAKGLIAYAGAAVPSAGTANAVIGTAFTTANAMGLSEEGPPEFVFRSLAPAHLEAVAEAARRAAGEAVVRSFLEARPVRGRSGRFLDTIPRQRLKGMFENHD